MNECADCRETRDAIHARLDGDTLSADVAERVENHVAGCCDCRELEKDLRSLQSALRGVILPKLPDDVAERVRRETTGTAKGPRWRLYGLAVAAVLAIALIAPRFVREAESPTPTRAEARQAAEQARLVFGVTARAMRRTQNAAVKRVLADEVAPALARVPVAWPRASDNRRERT